MVLAQVDTCVLGPGMYPGYEQCWSAVLEAPNSPLPFSGRPATAGEVDYAKWAKETPHFVLSTSMQCAVLLGRGKDLFKASPQRHRLTLVQTRPLPWGTVESSYRLTAA